MKQELSITDGSVGFFTIPTDAPEADGTFSWESTSMVLVQLACGNKRALGYTYADAGTAAAAQKLLKDVVSARIPSVTVPPCNGCSVRSGIWARQESR